MMPDSFRKTFFRITGILSLCAFLYAAINLTTYYADYRANQKARWTVVELKEQILDPNAAAREAEEQTAVVSTNEGGLEKLYTAMLDQNKDYVFWLTIPETTIDYPVVQRDNEYYLEHDFDGKVNAHGAIFLDEQCQSTEDALIIHGHHMKDGTMFSGLKDYKKEEFRESHREARVYLEQEERQYYFFAAAKVDLQEEDPFAYTALPTSKEAWQDYLNTLRYRAFWYEEPQNAADGRILILSTCDYDTENERLVLFGVSGKDPKISE